MKKKLILNLAVVAFAAFSFGFGALSNSISTTFAMEADDNGRDDSPEEFHRGDNRYNIKVNSRLLSGNKTISYKQLLHRFLPQNIFGAVCEYDDKKEELIDFLKDKTELDDEDFLNKIKDLTATSLKSNIIRYRQDKIISEEEADIAQGIIAEIRHLENIIKDYENKDN